MYAIFHIAFVCENLGKSRVVANLWASVVSVSMRTVVWPDAEHAWTF